MIWNKPQCPICNETLKTHYSDIDDSSLYVLACPTPVFIPEESFHEFIRLKSTYLKSSFKSHFQVEYQNNKPHYQIVGVFPFVIKSYEDCSNITKYDNSFNLHFVAETPFLDLPWKNRDKVIQKLQTYVLFS